MRGILFFLLPLGLFAQNATGFLEDYAVSVNYSALHYSKIHPWRVELAGEKKIRGLLIGPKEILVQCDDILDSAEIRVRHEKKTFEASILLADMEVNLCVLKTQDTVTGKNFHWKDFPFGEDPPVMQQITVYLEEKESSKLQQKNYSVTKYVITSDFGFTRLPVFITSSIENIQPGAIAFHKDKIAGLFSFSMEKKSYFLPVSRIKSFLQRFENGYSGFVAAGIELEPVSSGIKKLYAMEDQEQGCFVKRVFAGSGAQGILTVGDILLEVDGIKPDPQCQYEDPVLGRQKLEVLFSRKKEGSYRNPGEKVQIHYLRQGERKTAEMVLKSYYGNEKSPERIPWKVYGKQPYAVLFGVVFVELSRPFLIEKFGSNWRNRALELAYLYDYKRYYMDEENDRVVVISDIFPDVYNTGYQNFQGKPVRKLNGVEIKNLQHFSTLLQSLKKKKTIAEVELSDKRKLFFDFDKEEEHKRILEKFGIKQDIFPQ